MFVSSFWAICSCSCFWPYNFPLKGPCPTEQCLKDILDKVNNSVITKLSVGTRHDPIVKISNQMQAEPLHSKAFLHWIGAAIGYSTPKRTLSFSFHSSSFSVKPHLSAAQLVGEGKLIAIVWRRCKDTRQTQMNSSAYGLSEFAYFNWNWCILPLWQASLSLPMSTLAALRLHRFVLILTTAVEGFFFHCYSKSTSSRGSS